MGINFDILLVYLSESPDTSQVQFFTLETLFSAAGATTAVFTVTSVLHGFLPKISPRWFALLFSWLLTIIGIGVHHVGWTPSNILVAVINGFVIYAAAVGVNNVSTSNPPVVVAGVEESSARGRAYRWWP
jgi:hypothetical protein